MRNTQDKDEEKDMARSRYRWRRGNDQQHTRKVFEALSRVKDLDGLTEVEAVISHEGLLGVFRRLERQGVGVVVAEHPWIVLDRVVSDGDAMWPGAGLVSLTFTVDDDNLAPARESATAVSSGLSEPMRDVEAGVSVSVHDLSRSAGVPDAPGTADAPQQDGDMDLSGFNTSHRCDMCGAQAKVRAMFAAGPLLFCQHHATPLQPLWQQQQVRVFGGRRDTVAAGGAGV